mmetsp:Transcript_104075/g.143999  ORF Transcript_104075/g.143999 Transcript_104075/m.143999 type:complete len:111 (+) Transcript_104075:99-431(+)
MVSSFFSALSLIMQKIAHKRAEKTKGNAFKSCLWISGMALFIVANVSNMAVLPYADMVLFCTIGCMTLIFNSLLSYKLLNESFTRYDLVAVLLIMTGTSLVVLQTHKQEV